MEKKDNRSKRYSHEFKIEAVARCEKNGTSKASSELGIPVGTLNRWKKEQGAPGRVEPKGSDKPSYSELEKENRRLKKELGYIQEINQVLKKSTAIFSNSVMGGFKW